MRRAPDGADGTAFSAMAEFSARASAGASSIGTRTVSRSFFTTRILPSAAASAAAWRRGPGRSTIPPVTSPLEARTGLDPWNRADLPSPPDTRGLRLLGVVGPGAIVLGASIGSGEWLIGPAAVVKYGLSLLWVTAVAVLFQTIFNTEVVRYTLYTGEPAFTGFMRTRPGSAFRGWTYAVLYFLQNGWPGWAGATAGAVFFLGAGRAATAADARSVHVIGIGAYLLCVLILLLGGRRIERTMEILNWLLVIGILGILAAL